MSDAVSQTLHYIVESAYGTTPSTPAMKPLRHTSCSLGISKGALMSGELREDRQIMDFRHGTRQVGGEVATELAYGAQDDLMEAVLGGTWGDKVTALVSTHISAAAADNSINVTTEAFDTLIEAGDKVTITGFATSGNNLVKATVVSVTTTKIVLSGGTLVNESAGQSVTVTLVTKKLTTGTTRRSFSMLRRFTDQQTGDHPYHMTTGAVVNTMKLDVKVDALVMATFGIVGQNTETSATEPSGATYAARTTTTAFSAFSGVVKEGGSTIGIVSEISLNFDNGVAPKYVVGSDLTLNPSISRLNVTGQVTVYFEDDVMLAKFVSETSSSLEFSLIDAAGNKYRFRLPKIKYTGGQPDVKGQGPITMAMPFQASIDSTLGQQVQIERTAA